MSLAKKFQASDDSFGQLTRLFVALKRSGRIVDIVWFQESPEYARAVLALADGLDDLSIREAAIRLRQDLKEFLIQKSTRITQRAPAKPAEEIPTVIDRVGEPDSVPQTAGKSSEPPHTARYKGILR